MFKRKYIQLEIVWIMLEGEYLKNFKKSFQLGKGYRGACSRIEDISRCSQTNSWCIYRWSLSSKPHGLASETLIPKPSSYLFDRRLYFYRIFERSHQVSIRLLTCGNIQWKIVDTHDRSWDCLLNIWWHVAPTWSYARTRSSLILARRAWWSSNIR